MQPTDFQRPPTLYRYARRHWLERALRDGEFRLRPAAQELPAHPLRRAARADYLTLSLAQSWSERWFEQLPHADCCLVIHDSEQFGERLHRAVQKLLPDWAGIDAAVCYGRPSPLGAAFSKSAQYAFQQEWRFAWRPTGSATVLAPLVVRLGNIENFAELRDRGGSSRSA